MFGFFTYITYKIMYNGCDSMAKVENMSKVDCILFQAAGHNDVGLALRAVENGADINACNLVNITPLHFAAKYGSNDMINFLIERGADVNAETSETLITPLGSAVLYDNIDTAKLLIENGASVAGDNLLRLALKRMDIKKNAEEPNPDEMVKILIEKGVSTTPEQMVKLQELGLLPTDVAEVEPTYSIEAEEQSVLVEELASVE